MEIGAQELLAEAGQMALELRLKERALTALEAEVARLRARLSEFETASAGQKEPAEPQAGPVAG